MGTGTQAGNIGSPGCQPGVKNPQPIRFGGIFAAKQAKMMTKQPSSYFEVPIFDIAII